MNSAVLWATSLLLWVPLTALQYVKFCSPAGCQTDQRLRNARPRALWLLLTECHDPKLSAFALTGGFEIPGLKVLWDYISEGICDDGSWQVLLSSEWMNFAECHPCRELTTKYQRSLDKVLLYRYFFKNHVNCFITSVNSTHHSVHKCQHIGSNSLAIEYAFTQILSLFTCTVPNRRLTCVTMHRTRPHLIQKEILCPLCTFN